MIVIIAMIVMVVVVVMVVVLAVLMVRSGEGARGVTVELLGHLFVFMLS